MNWGILNIIFALLSFFWGFESIMAGNTLWAIILIAIGGLNAYFALQAYGVLRN